MRRTRWLPVLGEVMAAWTMIGASADVESTGRPALLASAVGSVGRSVGQRGVGVLAAILGVSVLGDGAILHSVSRQGGSQLRE